MKEKIIIGLLIFMLLACKSLWAETPKKVLVFPFEIHAQQDLSYLKKAIPEMLTSRLFSPDKITVLENDKVETELKNYSLLDKKVAEEIAKKLGADYVIWGSLTVIGEVVSIDAQIMDLSQAKKPAQFFQEIKGLSEVIPQLTRFARKAKKYIEGKEEDFYQEDLSLAYGGPGLMPGRAHPERGYFGYPLYPVRPPKEETPVEKAKPRFGGIGDPAYEGLTKDIVIDLSGPQPRIGIAREEKANATGKQPGQPPPYMYYYPPQPYYNYSPPPYYYYQAPKEEEGILSKIKSALWPFGREEKRYTPQPMYPQPVPVLPPPTPLAPKEATTQPKITPKPQKVTPEPIQAQPTPQVPPQEIPPKPPYAPEPSKSNPWRWE